MSRTTTYKTLFWVLLPAFILMQGARAQQPIGGVSGSLTVKNSYIYNDPDYPETGSAVQISYSAVRAGTAPPGAGNIALSSESDYEDQLVVPNNTSSYYLSPLSILVNAGSSDSGLPQKDINGNERIYDGIIDIGPVEYSMIFKNGNGNWNSSAGWNVGRIPNEYDIVTVLDETSVTVSDAVCKSIIQIGNSGKIIIEPASQLEVKTTINNTNANNILVKASTLSPNGTLIFQNALSSPVSATVEMHSVAFVDENLEQDDDAKFNWQYFGIPMRTLAAIPSFEGAWVRKWNEASIEFSKWEELTIYDILTSFKGYEIVQNEEKIYTFQGVLENKDTTIVLSKSGVPYYSGQHVLSNPYTASIKIEDIVFGNNTEATVYVYNSGSYDDWNADSGNGRLGTDRGQYLAVPQNAASLILPEIPSMQGFIVRATSNNGSITIPYASASQNVQKQRVKKISHTPYLRVDLAGSKSSDRLWLLHEPNASRNFDNGWDGYKIFKGDASAVIYFRESAGNLQVNTVDDFNHINLDFKPGKDSEYSLTLVNNGLNDIYPEMYLVDLFDNKVVEIGADTTRYNFSSGNYKKTNRFRIMSRRVEVDEIQSVDLIEIYYTDNHILIQNLTTETGMIDLYDMSGRLLLQQKMEQGVNSLTVKNTDEIVLLKAYAGNERIIKKILLKQ
ncbi:MAG: hypothetical protein Q7J05_03695 [Paludibacter sp.]|nr:hypothetical protein [Paludibacter sp.]